MITALQMMVDLLENCSNLKQNQGKPGMCWTQAS
jgi:hypothetical protein